MAFIDHSNAFSIGARPIAFDPRTPAAEESRLSPLEWLIVAVARHDRLSSLREPGRLGRVFGTLFGSSRSNGLANDKLEALRQLAVRLWRQGRDYDGPEIPTFLAAGYSPAHFSLVAASIDAARAQ